MKSATKDYTKIRKRQAIIILLYKYLTYFTNKLIINQTIVTTLVINVIHGNININNLMNTNCIT